MKNFYEVVIIGCGPAGMGAALELQKAGVDFLLVEKDAPGGKVNIAPRVDNYPGYKEIPGPDLAFHLFQRILDNKVPFLGDEVLSLTKEGGGFLLKLKFNGEIKAKAVLLASGTRERKLGMENEEKLFTHGISYCALCDGHFFKGQDVAVVGGGNVALKEAIHLATLCNKVYLIHRRNEFRGDKKLVREIECIPNIEIITPYVPYKIVGDERLTALEIQNREDQSIRVLNIQGLFLLIGQDPNSEYINIENVKNEYGTVPHDRGMKTNCDGLFVAGDLTPRDIRQIYLAEHDGKVAAKSILEFLGK